MMQTVLFREPRRSRELRRIRRSLAVPKGHTCQPTCLPCRMVAAERAHHERRLSR